MAVTIQSGPARVLDSGTVTCFNGHDLTLVVTEPAPFHLEVGFLTDDEVEDVEVNVVKKPEGLRMVCVNFDGTDGRGSSEPVLLCEVGEELLFLHFRVFRYGRTDDRTFTYTLFSARKSDLNWTTTQSGD